MLLKNDERAILEVLDNAAKEYIFPMLNNVNFTNAAIQAKVFLNKEEWLLIFEGIIYSVKNFFQIDVTALGNKAPDTMLTYGVSLFDESDQTRILKACKNDQINDQDIRFTVNNKEIRINTSVQSPEIAGVDPIISEPGQFLRWVTHYYKDALFLSNDHLLKTVHKQPGDLSLFMHLIDWHHPDIADDEMPSENTCFISLAEAMAAGDASLYHCEEDDFNTHWSNWGNL